MKLLIMGDSHLRADRPRCRLDENWLDTQKAVLDEIGKIAAAHDAAVVHTGDLFDSPAAGNRVMSMAMRFIDVPKAFYSIAGNHDLPYHSWDNKESSSYGVLWESGKVQSLLYFGAAAHFGETMEFPPAVRYAFIHRLVFPSAKAIPPNVDAISAAGLLSEFPQHIKWIFTGDYHHSFHYEKGGRHVVNPGCIIRQAADMIDYKPSVYIFDTDTESLDQIYLIADTGEMVTDLYLKTESERTDRISAFVESIKTSGEFSLDFADNVRKMIAADKSLPEKTKNKINSLLDIQGET